MANGFEALRRRGINIQASPEANLTEAERIQGDLTSAEVNESPIGMEHLQEIPQNPMDALAAGRNAPLPPDLEQIKSLLGGELGTMTPPDIERLLGGAAPPSVQEQAPLNLPIVEGNLEPEVPPPPAQTEGEVSVEELSGGMFSEDDIKRGEAAKKLKEAGKKAREFRETLKEME